MILYNLLFWIGMWQIGWWVCRTIDLLFRTFFGTEVSTKRYGENTWAVVTGATDGIGLAAAKHLARKGFNIVLMSRTLEKLNSCAADIKTLKSEDGKSVKTRVI